ncbi:MAG: hypothetical protein JW816_01270 [Candidatus Buchananbacteria bacterium]|nr:hypothetical protein [Candidatus Buchananbacteria bacterium]
MAGNTATDTTELKVGETFEVTKEIMDTLQLSREFEEKDETPYLIKVVEQGLRFRPATDGDNRLHLFIIFVPTDIQVGDWLQLQWVDPTCACATKEIPRM